MKVALGPVALLLGSSFQRPAPAELVLLGPVDASVGLFRVVDAELNPCVELVFTHCVKRIECRSIDEEVVNIAVVLLVGVPGRVRVLRCAVEVYLPVHQATSLDLNPE